MVSPTQWMWVWANSGRWWRIRKPGMLQSVGSQVIRHDLVTEQQPWPKTQWLSDAHTFKIFPDAIFEILGSVSDRIFTGWFLGEEWTHSQGQSSGQAVALVQRMGQPWPHPEGQCGVPGGALPLLWNFGFLFCARGQGHVPFKAYIGIEWVRSGESIEMCTFPW